MIWGQKGIAYAAALLALTFAGVGRALAADKPVYAPPPAWVKPVSIPAKTVSTGGANTQVLLQNSQLHFGPEGDESYQEFAVRVLTPQGLSAVGNFIMPWRPDTDTLTIHRLNIIREGQTIDLLDGGKNVTVLRRETNLELAMLDGALTATIQPVGLQVGDIIDFAYTLRSQDPVLEGHSIGFAQLLRPGVIQRAYFRAVWPRAKSVRWRATEGMGKPLLSPIADNQELMLDESGAEAPKPPNGAPARFNNLAQFEFSDFASWSQISALMAPLYAKAETLGPNSPIKAEIDRIAASSADSKTRAASALKLVEDKIRYVALAMNRGGYVPADIDQTWARRFGDCKGKTVLLLALLKGLGIDAEPVLVSTGAGDGLNERLPVVLFDHVMVRARIAGKVYWLDGTRQGDGALDNLSMPNYHWILPVTARGAELEKLSPPPYTEPHFESVLKLDAKGGLDAPAPAHAEHVFRGDEGLIMHFAVQATAPTDIDKALKDYWRGKIAWIEPKRVSFAYDEAAGALTLSMDGLATIDWAKSSGDARDFDIADSALGYEANFDRDAGPFADAPYAVDFPMFNRSTTIVQLPDKGAGFLLGNAVAIDKMVAGVQYRRQAKIENGLATIETQQRAAAPDFPASEARAASADLRSLSEYNVVIRSSPSTAKARAEAAQCRGDIPDVAIMACTELLEKAPTGTVHISAVFVARGGAYIKKGEFDRAIRDFTSSIQLKDDEPAAFIGRGAAYFRDGKPDLAVEDFNEALRLRPNDASITSWLGDAYRQMKNWDNAIQYYDKAIGLKPGESLYFASRAQTRQLSGDLDAAIEDYDKAIQLKPDYMDAFIQRGKIYMAKGALEAGFRDLDEVVRISPNKASALNSRCWARAELGQGLDLALADCEAAVGLQPNNASILDSRGFVHFRRGEYDSALADLDSALKLNPKLAASLYIRGLAKQRLNRSAEADADIAMAKALSPAIAETYAKMGVTPQETAMAAARP